MTNLEYVNENNVRLTRRQKHLVIKIVKGHIEDSNFVFAWAKMNVNKYFVALNFYYYPKTAVDNPYLVENKTFFIGPKGAMKRATYQSGTGKPFNVAKYPESYFRADNDHFMSHYGKPADVVMAEHEHDRVQWEKVLVK